MHEPFHDGDVGKVLGSDTEVDGSIQQFLDRRAEVIDGL
jgi:hypothetical protein